MAEENMPHAPGTTTRSYGTLVIALIVLTLCGSGLWLYKTKSTTSSEQGSAQELTSCFDHYHFGSIYASVESSLVQATQSGNIEFTGKLYNKDTASLSEGVIWLRISRIETSSTSEALYPVALYKVKDNISLSPGQDLSYSTVWKIPSDLPEGTYTAATYVTSHDLFSHSGVLYSSKATGPTTSFTVTGTTKGTIYVDTTKVLVAGSRAASNDFPVVVPKEEPVELSAPVVNTSDIPYKGKIVWRVYSSNALSKDSLITEESQEVKIHPHTSTFVTLTIKDTAHATYYVQGEIETPGGTHSSIDVRFTRKGTSEPSLVYAGIDKGSAFACVHSEGTEPSSDSQVSLVVTSDSLFWRVLGTLGITATTEKKYSGSLPLSYSAITTKILHPMGRYHLTATVSEEGNVVGKISQTVSCEEAQACPAPWLRTLYIVIPIFVFIVILVVLIRIYKKRRENQKWESQDWMRKT